MHVPCGGVLKGCINQTFQGKEPWQIVTTTTTGILATIWLWNFIFQDESIVVRGRRKMYKLLRKIHFIRKKIDEQLETINESFKTEALKRSDVVPFITELPNEGYADDWITEKVEQYIKLGDYNWKDGKVSGTVYRNDEGLIELISHVYAKSSYTNPLHPDVFPGICKMEAEVVRIACRLFNGDDNTCGTMTSGGTESILLACKAYRDYGKANKNIKYPEIIMPVTAHSAFDKAAEYLKIKIKRVPVNKNCVVSVNTMKKYITGNTIMIVASAPNFPYGTMDNVEKISELGLSYDVPVHVDACLGGFLLCFMEEAGYTLPCAFDFRLPGVTSISADTHKYGYAPKGSSVILYREKKYRHHQYSVTTDWPGGIYGSPTVSGSRAGGTIATCWATLMYFGRAAYVESTKKIIEVRKWMEDQLKEIDGIFIYGEPVTSVIAIGSTKFHIYTLGGDLSALGWNLNTLQFPVGIHICLTYMHTEPDVAQKFVNDVKTAVANILTRPPDESLEGKMALYGMSQTIPDRTIVGDFTRSFLDSLYFTPD